MSKIKTGGFPKELKKGTGLSQQKDLSHKVSAKQTDIMFQTVSTDPSHVKRLLPALKKAAKPVDRQKRKFDESVEYLEKHPTYGSAPMSPKSRRAAHDTFNIFANKSEDNLRPRPDTENRSIGEYPHFNFDNKGNLSPRSSRQMEVVKEFGSQYQSQLDPDDRQVTDAYTGLVKRAKTSKTPFKTEDQVDHASKARNGKL